MQNNQALQAFLQAAQQSNPGNAQNALTALLQQAQQAQRSPQPQIAPLNPTQPQAQVQTLPANVLAALQQAQNRNPNPLTNLNTGQNGQLDISALQAQLAAGQLQRTQLSLQQAQTQQMQQIQNQLQQQQAQQLLQAQLQQQQALAALQTIQAAQQAQQQAQQVAQQQAVQQAAAQQAAAQQVNQAAQLQQLLKLYNAQVEKSAKEFMIVAPHLTEEDARAIAKVQHDPTSNLTPEQRSDVVKRALMHASQRKPAGQASPPAMIAKGPMSPESTPASASSPAPVPNTATDAINPNFATLYHSVNISSPPAHTPLDKQFALTKLKHLYEIRTKRSPLNLVWKEPDCKPGSYFFFELPTISNVRLPPDGLEYLEEEQMVDSQDDEGTFQIFERVGGYKKGDATASVKRRRYRLAYPTVPMEFQILQYLKMDPPVAVKSEKKEGPVVLDRLAQNYMATPSGQAPTGFNQLNAAYTANQLQKGASIEEVGGDVLDRMTVREVALARYKRNHGIMAEILSPIAVSKIIPSKVSDGVDVEFFQKYLNDSKDDSTQEMVKEIRDEVKTLKTMTDKINTLTSIEEVDNLLREFEAIQHVKILEKAILPIQ